MVHKERHIVNVDPFVKNGRVDDILDRIEVFVCRFQTDSRNEHAYRKFEGFVFKPQVDFLDLHRNVGQDLIQSIQTISRRSWAFPLLCLAMQQVNVVFEALESELFVVLVPLHDILLLPAGKVEHFKAEEHFWDDDLYSALGHIKRG